MNYEQKLAAVTMDDLAAYRPFYGNGAINDERACRQDVLIGWTPEKSMRKRLFCAKAQLPCERRDAATKQICAEWRKNLIADLEGLIEQLEAV